MRATPRYLSPEDARRFYNRLGPRQDWQAFFERAPVGDLLAHARLATARHVFEFGFGTGALAATMLADHLAPDARYVGLDISDTMVALARRRLARWPDRARIYRSDRAPWLPEADRDYDRFLSSYVFDLLPPAAIAQLLAEAHRLLIPGGLLGLVSLTHGASGFPRAVSGFWTRLWHCHPRLVGGCRPLRLGDHLPSGQWQTVHRAVMIRWGVSSEVLVASAR